MSDVTRLLDAASGGDPQAAALLPLVYDELRALAAARMAAETPGRTLDAMAHVHEAYLRLIGDQRFDGRGHFFAAAAEAMRRNLIDHARNRRKRGGGRGPADGVHDGLGGTRFPPAGLGVGRDFKPANQVTPDTVSDECWQDAAGSGSGPLPPHPLGV